MGLFENFPYTNFHELNLDWILQMLKKIDKTMDEFVAINALKYADPIQWDITSQYEKNTIVIDPQSGTAYISVQPVPIGAALTNTDYWTVVFDLERFVTEANNNFTVRVEEATTLTATFPTNEGQWVVWGGELYEALVNIVAGDQYVPDSNIRRLTVEVAINSVLAVITQVSDNLADEVSNRVAADTTLQNNIDVEALARGNADNTLQGNIDAEALARGIADNTLQGNIDAEALARDNADTAIMNMIGQLSDLQTLDKSSIVNAINELEDTIIGSYDTADIRNYGGKGDGVTNDTAAFNACLAANNLVYLPYFSGCAGYVLDEVTLSDHQSVIGDNRTIIIQNATRLFTIVGNYVTIKNLFIRCSTVIDQTVFNMQVTGDTGMAFHYVIEDISIDNPYTIFTDANSSQQYICTYMNNIIGYRTRGVGYYVHHAFAFLFMKSCTTDRNQLQANYLGFDFNNVEGLHLDYCEVSAGYLNTDSQTGSGFSFVNCRAVWMTNCFSDYISGLGYDFNGCSYIHINGSGASLTTLGGYRFYNCHFVEMVECYIAGQDNTTPYNSGLWIGNSDKFTVGNCVIDKYTYDGIYITRSTGVIVSNCSITNTTQNSIEIDTCTNSMAIGCRGDDTMINNSAANNSYILDCISSSGFTDDRPSI